MNTLTVAQVYQVMNDLVQQAQGRKGVTPTNTSEFVSVGTSLLKTGYDPVYGAISQVLSRTIFSARPYRRRFPRLERDMAAFGNHVRKINYSDLPLIEDKAYVPPVTTGQTTDTWVNPFTVRKQKLYQSNFYGMSTFADHETITNQQLKVAFQNPQEMAGFLSGIYMNINNRLEQAREEYARGTILNLIGGILAENNQNRVIHLLSEYNALTGSTYTAQQIYRPGVFESFVRWLYARVRTVSARLEERSVIFHTNINEYPIQRHTPRSMQIIYLYAPLIAQMQSMAIDITYHDTGFNLGSFREINYWQSIESPDTVSVTPEIVNPADGSTSKAAAVEQSNVVGLIFDEEAAGYAQTANSLESIYNPAGKYTSLWYEIQMKNWNDMTENAVVLLLD